MTKGDDAPSGGMGGADMVERVARAICKSRTCEGWACCQCPGSGGRTSCPVKAGGYDDAARAAIAAMREPTDAMVRTGAVAVMASGRASNAVCHLWRKMIDASLTQSTGGDGPRGAPG